MPLHINLVIGTNAEQNDNSTAIVLNLLVKKISKSVERFHLSREMRNITVG